MKTYIEPKTEIVSIVSDSILLAVSMPSIGVSGGGYEHGGNEYWGD